MAKAARTDRRNISSGGAYEGVFGYSRAVRAGSDVHVSGTLHNVVRTVVYVRDIEDADLVARAHFESFDKIRPASTLVQVTSMLRPWQKVEIEAYAKV